MSETYHLRDNKDANLIVLRREFARALVMASYCEGDDLCTCVSGCLTFEQLANQVKLGWIGSVLSFENPGYRVTPQMRDALMFLEFIYASGKSTERVFEGFLEVPASVYPIVRYVERFIERPNSTEERVKQSKTIAAEMFACLAFPDDYLHAALELTARDHWD